MSAFSKTVRWNWQHSPWLLQYSIWTFLTLFFFRPSAKQLFGEIRGLAKTEERFGNVPTAEGALYNTSSESEIGESIAPEVYNQTQELLHQ